MRSVYDVLCPRCCRVLETGRRRCPIDGVDTVRRARAPTGAVLARRYRLDEVIGRGGWATVYRARDLQQNDNAAVKLLNPLLRAHARSVRRFLFEARTLAKLAHPHVVTVRDWGQSGRSVFTVLELNEGSTLAELILERAPLGPARAVHIALQILEGLGAAHARGLVHHDLKPDNVLFTQESGEAWVKVADFGIARSLVDDVSGDSGGFNGTPAYSSPEQAQCDRMVDHRSDLFALGLILYEMLTGEPAYPYETALATLQRRAVEPPVEIDRAFPDLDLPAGLTAAVTKLLAHSRDDRPQSAREAALLLAPAHAAEPVEANEVPTVFVPLDLSPRTCGRQTEIERLLPLVERLPDHPHATLLTIFGESGMGKSHLARHLADECAKRGSRRYQRTCGDGGQPLHELAEVIEDLLSTRHQERAVLLARCTELLGDRNSAEVLCDVLRPVPDESRAQRTAGQDHQCHVVLDALAHLAASTPVVVVLDDAHTADSLTRALLARLPLWSHDRGRGLLVIATHMTDDASPPEQPRGARVADRAPLVTLGPLSDAETDALLVSVGLRDGEARSVIAGLCGGNPLRLMQLIRHFRSERLLVPTRRGWRLAPRTRQDLSVPDAISILGARQVEQLRARPGAGGLAADLLERLALIGQSVPAAILTGTLEREGRSDLLEKMEVLVDLLVAEGLVRWRDGSLTFVHGMFREAIASRVSEKPETAALHVHIAEVLCDREGMDHDAEALRAAASHLHRGGAPRRALPLALRSAALSRSMGDYPRASEVYLLALRILEARGSPSRTARLEIELGLGETLVTCGETGQAEEHFQKALALSDCAAAHLGLGRVAELRADLDVAREHLGKAERMFGKEGRSRDAAEALLVLGRMVAKTGDLERARGHYESAERLLQDLGDSIGTARALLLTALLDLYTGEYQRGVELLEGALPVFEESGNPLYLGDCFSAMGSMRAEMGQLELAAELHGKAKGYYERAGMLRGVANALGAIGRARGQLGSYDEGQHLQEASLRLSEDIDHQANTVVCLGNLGVLCRRAGKLEEATQWLRSCLAQIELHGNRVSLPFVCLELGLTFLARGRLREARTWFRRLLSIPHVRKDLRAKAKESLEAIACREEGQAKTKGRKRPGRGAKGPAGEESKRTPRKKGKRLAAKGSKRPAGKGTKKSTPTRGPRKKAGKKTTGPRKARISGKAKGTAKKGQPSRRAESPFRTRPAKRRRPLASKKAPSPNRRPPPSDTTV